MPDNYAAKMMFFLIVCGIFLQC